MNWRQFMSADGSIVLINLEMARNISVPTQEELDYLATGLSREKWLSIDGRIVLETMDHIKRWLIVFGS